MSTVKSNKILVTLYSSADITKAAISDFVTLLEENIEDEKACQYVNEYLNYSEKYVSAIERLTSAFVIDIDWAPPACLEALSQVSSNSGKPTPTSPTIELKYLDGQSPWSFWLTYNSSPEYDSLFSALKSEWRQGNLRRLSNLPLVGSYVVCVERNSVFRAVVLSTNIDRVRVRNVDDTCVKLLKLENIYVMKRKLNTVHAKTVNCCLSKDESMMKLWNSDLSELFKSTLKESVELEVRFEEVFTDCVPPKYLISLSSKGESKVDFNDWINNKLLVELTRFIDRIDEIKLEDLPESAVDPYYKESKASTGVKKVHFTQSCPDESNLIVDKVPPVWSSQLIMPSNPVMVPYYLNPVPHQGAMPPSTLTAHYTTTTFLSNMPVAVSTCPYSQQVTTSSRIILNPRDLSSSKLNANTPVFRPRDSDLPTTNLKEILPVCNEEKDLTLETTIMKQPEEEVVQSKATEVSPEDVCASFNKYGFCLLSTSSCNKIHMRLDVSNNKPADPNNISSVGVKSEKVGGVKCEEPNTNRVVGSSYESEEEDLEEPSINGGYIPTDEKRICKFPVVKNGRCWKPQCTKEHQDPNILKYKWTSDTLETMRDLLNCLDIPEIGETIEFLVTVVRNPFTFYARLPDTYSDIGEGIDNIETFRTLHKSLNDPKNIKKYKLISVLDLAEGEIYLAKAKDSFWKRARVLEAREKDALVFFVDYGCEEVVSKNSFRILEDRFSHLPPQAVMCTLSNLYCSPDDEELRRNGTKYLKKLLTGRVVIGKVINRNLEETSLELLVHLKSRNKNEEDSIRDINLLMVSQGFCDQIDPMN